MVRLADGRPKFVCYDNVVQKLLLPVLLMSLGGCLHEPDADLDENFFESSYASSQPAARSEIAVGWQPSAAQEVQLPPLPASPKDRPPPDPVPFRIGAGHGALGLVDLAPCREVGLEPGYVHLRVTFHRSGRIVAAVVESPAPPPSEALDCVAQQLEDATVPAFDGRDASMSKSVFVEPGPEPLDIEVRKGKPGIPAAAEMQKRTTASR
jgi:hypothetical protein